MKIVFATEGNRGLKERVSQHFGRCPTYTVVDVDEKGNINVEVVENPTLQNHAPGMAPQFIASLGADYIVSGGMGPRAIQNFEVFNIHPITGASGEVKANLDYIIEQLRNSGVLPAPQPCEEHQHGE